MTTNETPTPRTDAIAHAGHNESVYIARMTYLARELERERAALAKAADKLEEDKEYNARLCESLSAELEQERQLADRLATSLDVLLEYVETGDGADHSDAHTASRALAAWKEARRGA